MKWHRRDSKAECWTHIKWFACIIVWTRHEGWTKACDFQFLIDLKFILKVAFSFHWKSCKKNAQHVCEAQHNVWICMLVCKINVELIFLSCILFLFLCLYLVSPKTNLYNLLHYISIRSQNMSPSKTMDYVCRIRK